MSNTTTAPIVLIVFNRPNHTARVIDALAVNPMAAESDLYVYSDAPRDEADRAGVEGVRNLIRSIQGFRSVNLVERPENYGCRRNVLSAVSETLEGHDRCIVVEDDILASPLFLTYMNQALAQYEHESCLASIGAYTQPFNVPKDYQNPLFICQRHCAWGWGTWKSVWMKLTENLFVLDDGMADPVVQSAFLKACGEDLIRTYERLPDSWDLLVTYKAWTLGLYTLYPMAAMVKNIGRDGSGTNYTKAAGFSEDTFLFPETVPPLGPLPEPDKRVIRAFLKTIEKPRWRRVLVALSKGMGVYDALVRLAASWR